MRRPHPMFWLLCATLVLAAVVALAVEARAPGYALDAVVVYRIEVGAVVFAAEYLLLLVLLLGWHGRTLSRVELPGGAAVELDPAPGLETAAEEFDAYRASTDDRLDLLEQNFDLLAAGGPPPDQPGSRALDDGDRRGTLEEQ